MAVLEIGIVTPEMDDQLPRFIKWPDNLRIPVAGDYWQESGEKEYFVMDVQWRYDEPHMLRELRVIPILYVSEPADQDDCDCGFCD